MSEHYKCKNCGRTFHEKYVMTKHTSHEAIIGLSGHTPLDLSVCPYCRSEDIEETFISSCSTCDTYLTGKSYEFFNKSYCDICIMEFIPDSEDLLREYIKDSCEIHLSKFEELIKTNNIYKVIGFFEAKDSLFLEDYLLFLEEKIAELKEACKSASSIEDILYSKLCDGCASELHCHWECCHCDKYLEEEEKLESLLAISTLIEGGD